MFRVPFSIFSSTAILYFFHIYFVPSLAGKVGQESSTFCYSSYKIEGWGRNLPTPGTQWNAVGKYTSRPDAIRIFATFTCTSPFALSSLIFFLWHACLKTGYYIFLLAPLPMPLPYHLSISCTYEYILTPLTPNTILLPTDT